MTHNRRPRTRKNERCIVYLIHYAYPCGRVDHYVGSTKPETAARRLRAHQEGYGCNATYRHYAAGARATVAKQIAAPSRALEYALHRITAIHTLCPICSRFQCDQISTVDLTPILPKK